MNTRSIVSQERETVTKIDSGAIEMQEGWVTASLSELLAALESGSRPRGGVRGIADGVPSIGGEHLNYDGTFNFEAIKYVPHDFAVTMKKGRIQLNDILIVKDGATTGKTAFVGTDFPYAEAFVNEHVFICRPKNEVEARFLFRFLMSKDGKDRILENFKGSAQGGINQTFAPNVTIPIAPLAEQRRIVSKLEEVLGKVQQSQQRLARIPALLKRFRQSVLAAACSGKLTAVWRESRQLSQVFETVLLEDVADYLGGFAYRSPTFTCNGKYQVIRIGNVRPMRLDITSSPVFISNAIAEETERFRLRANDIVVSMTGTKYKRDYGFASLVREEDGSLFLNQRVSRVRCGSKLMPQFLLYWMHSDLFRNHFFAGETGNVNQGNVGADGIRKAQIELPSLTEQQEIVKRVEQLFAFADQIEARFKKAQAQVDRLTQSVLAKAFRGELVPTEAELARRENRSYESASELLARIQSEREISSEATKATPKRKRTTTRN